MGNVNMHSTDESTCTKPYGVTQVVRNFFGGGSRAQDTMLAISIIVNVMLAFLLHDAWKDLGTQVWLRSDSLTKENAEIRGHVIAIEDLIQSYGMGKNIPRPPPLKEEQRK
jgi:hypothetical protein